MWYNLYRINQCCFGFKSGIAKGKSINGIYKMRYLNGAK